MTGQELLDKLSKLSKEELELEVYAEHGASGVSYSLYGPSLSTIEDDGGYEGGVLCELDSGTRFIELDLDD